MRLATRPPPATWRMRSGLTLLRSPSPSSSSTSTGRGTFPNTTGSTGRSRAARVLETTPVDWSRALAVHRQQAASGAGHQRSVRLVDLIIAAVAERAGLAVVHIDEDYERITAITGQATRRLP